MITVAEAPPLPNADARDLFPLPVFLRRGATIPLRIFALRRDGFTGEIQLAATNLPTGVIAWPSKIETNANSARLLLTAADDAEAWLGPVSVVGNGKSGERELRREAVPASVTWTVGNYNDQPVFSRLGQELTITVATNETSPIIIRPVQSVITSSATGKVSVALQILRTRDDGKDFKLKVVSEGALAKLPEISVGAKATNATLELDLAKLKPQVFAYSLHFETQTPAKYRVGVEAAQAAEESAKLAEAESAKAGKANKEAAEHRKITKDALKKANDAFKKAEAASLTANNQATEDLDNLRGKAKEAADADAEAEKQEAETKKFADAAIVKKDAAQKKSKDAAKRAEAKETPATFYSPAIQIVINPFAADSSGSEVEIKR